jgi:hypothetical protein
MFVYARNEMRNSFGFSGELDILARPWELQKLVIPLFVAGNGGKDSKTF